MTAPATTDTADAPASALKALYVYGIAPARGGRTPRSAGVDGAPVRLLTGAGLCAAGASRSPAAAPAP
ncbi:hypothetical protein SVIOM342S_05754 [Streptomyces violaceorubidus]